MTRSLLPRAIAAALATSALAATTPAFAAPSRAELEASVVQMENTVAELQRRLSALEGGGGGEAGGSRLESVQSELVRVVGELEELRFQNQQLVNELRNLKREIQLRDAEIAQRLGLDPAFTDIDDDLGSSRSSSFGPAITQAAGGSFGVSEPPLGEPGTGPVESDPSFFGADPHARERAAAMGTLGGPPQPLPDDPAAALAAAKSLLIDGRFDEAQAAFAEFQQKFGDSPQAGEALYWQGEAHNLRGEFEDAKDLYIESLRKDASGPRAPDAMVALASSLQSLNLNTEACNTLASFPRQYPNAALSVRSKAERVRQAAGCR